MTAERAEFDKDNRLGTKNPAEGMTADELAGFITYARQEREKRAEEIAELDALIARLERAEPCADSKVTVVRHGDG